MSQVLLRGVLTGAIFQPDSHEPRLSSSLSVSANLRSSPDGQSLDMFTLELLFTTL